MRRVLFQIGPVTIYSYGVFLALAFVTGTFLARYRYSEKYKNPDIILDFVLAALIGGIIGARLFYVVGHWKDFASNPGSIFSLNMEGLVFYGGLIFGLGFALIVGALRKQRFWDVMDLAGLCIAPALAIGRIGCLLNGCCYGKPSTLPWSITFPVSTGIVGSRHPTQLYELILNLILFAILWKKRDSFLRKGTTFFLFLMGYSAIRFFVEFFREHANPKATIFFQLLSAFFFLFSAVVLLFRYRLLPPAKSGNDLL